jgi:predicted transport protein
MKATINVPSSLNEITLGQYQEYLSKAEGLEGYALAQCTVEVFCAVPKVSVMKISLLDITSITNHLNELFVDEQMLQLSFKIKSENVSQEFGFINDIENMSLGEYADVDTNISDWSQMHKVMAVLYRPLTDRIKDKYTIVDYEGTADYAYIMKFMPLDIALGALVFFYHLGNELLKGIRSYLVKETQELILAGQPNSTNNGGGTTQSTRLLKETLENLTKLPDYQLPRLSLI